MRTRADTTKIPNSILLACLVVAVGGSLIVHGCGDGADTPAPGPLGGPVDIRVFVCRGPGDGTTPPTSSGYGWTDMHIKALVRQMIHHFPLMAGTGVEVNWPGETITTILEAWAGGHIWAPYTTWSDSLSDHPQAPYNVNYIRMFFVPGIIDAAQPSRYMEAWTLDPAMNQDPYYISGGGSDSKPFILVSDCYVYGGVAPPPYPGTVISTYEQLDMFICERVMGAYMLRRENTTGFDHHEYDVLEPYTFMSHCVYRNGSVDPVIQQEILTKVNGNWNAP